jgi:hypothetical protein
MDAIASQPAGRTHRHETALPSCYFRAASLPPNRVRIRRQTMRTEKNQSGSPRREKPDRTAVRRHSSA